MNIYNPYVYGSFTQSGSTSYFKEDLGVGFIDGIHPSAKFEVSGITKGVLFPRMTETQKNAISTPATSLLIYQTDGTSGYQYYNGVAWSPIGGATGNFIPYTGATQDADLGIHQLKADSLAISTASTESVDVGEIVWNSIDGTFDMGLIGGVTLQAGQEMHFYGKATEAISNGQAVMFAGVQGDHILIAKADAATINANPEYFIGVATQNFVTNQFGYVTAFGYLRGVNTSGYTLGTILYYDSTTSTDGLLTATKPPAPNARIEVAAVVKVHATEGILIVRPHVMPKINDIQDVSVTSVQNLDILQYNSSTSVWVNTNTPRFASVSATTMSAVTFTGNLTGTASLATSATTALNSTNVGVTNNTTTNATYYPTFVSATSGNLPLQVDSATLTFNPSTNTLTVPNLSGTASLATSATTALNSTQLNGQLASFYYPASNPNGYTTNTGTVTGVNKGNGMDFSNFTTSGTITLGAPSSTTLASTNAVTSTSHTHAFAPGGTTAQYITGAGTLVTFPTIVNTFVTGSTINNSTYDLTLTRNDGVTIVTNLGILATDVRVTGGTYNINTGIVTFTNSTGGTFNVTGFSSGMTDTFVTGGTYNAGTATFTRNNNASFTVTGFNTGTVTSVGALTLGTTGTDLSSTVANGTTTPVITLNVPTASAANRGALSSTDWSTFNNKQAQLNGTGFVKAVGTTISYDNSTYYLASNPNGYTTNVGTVTSVSGTGTVNGITLIGNITSSGALTLGGTLGNIANNQLQNSSIQIGTTVMSLGTAYASIAGLSSVSSTSFTGNLTGTASLATSATTALNSTQLNGQSASFYYPASNPNGYTTNTGTVTGVNSGNGMNFTNFSTSGTITLGTPSSLTLSSTNSVTGTSHTHAFAPGGTTAQYITGAGTLVTFPTIPTVNNGTLSMATSGIATGSASFTANQSGNSTFTVNVPATNLSIGVSSGTAVRVDSSTGTNADLPVASATLAGVLSSANWTTFNNKQNALTNPVTGTGTINYLSKFTGTNTIGNSQIFDNGTNVGIGTVTPIEKLDVVGNTKVTGLINNTLTSASQMGLKQLLSTSYSLGSQLVGGNYTSLSFSGSVAHTVQSSSAADMRIGVSSGNIVIPAFGVNFPAEIVGFNLEIGSDYSSIFSQKVDTTVLGGGPLTRTGIVSVFGGNEEYQVITDSQEKSLRVVKFNTSGRFIKLELNSNSTGFVLTNDLPNSSASLFKILNSSSQTVFEALQDKVVNISGLVTVTGDKVGIGNPSPSYKLDVIGDGRFTGTLNGSVDINANGNLTAGANIVASAYGRFSSALTGDRVFIGDPFSVGPVGVWDNATQTGIAVYDVAGGVFEFANREIRVDINTGYVCVGGGPSGAGKFEVLGDNGGGGTSIYASDNIVSFSDISVKENIRPIFNVLDRVVNSRGVVYDRIDSKTKNNIGFIAQELEEQFPELVTTNPDGTKAVKYQNATAVLFEAVKEQQKQIDSLQEQINNIFAKLD